MDLVQLKGKIEVQVGSALHLIPALFLVDLDTVFMVETEVTSLDFMENPLILPIFLYKFLKSNFP